jgi:glutaredoxin 3
MTDITVYTTGPSEVCSRVRHLLDARGLVYDLVLVESEQELVELSERSGRKSCPLVYVGSELIGGLQETIAAERSGRLARLAHA